MQPLLRQHWQEPKIQRLQWRASLRRQGRLRVGLSRAMKVVVLATQVGHCESDLIVECEVGLILIFSSQLVAVVSEGTYPVM